MFSFEIFAFFYFREVVNFRICLFRELFYTKLRQKLAFNMLFTLVFQVDSFVFHVVLVGENISIQLFLPI